MTIWKNIFFNSLCLSNVLFAKENPIVIEDLCSIPVINPAFKDQQTLKLQLSNGLQAYIISDPEASTAGAVLTVQAGSWDDPKDYPGLAHFLEHMLFLGTEKYPIESDYDRFIKEHNGQTNAYTTTDYTLYCFSVSPPAYEEALDRFSSFFKQPLFNPSGVSRELHAVDQEFAKNLQHDSIRTNYVTKELANFKHPFCQFNAGNLQTLSNVSRKTLIEWYQKNYSAHQMKVIIYGPQSLEELKNLFIQDFKDVAKIDREREAPNCSIYDEKIQNKIIFIESVKNKHILYINWEMPPRFALKNTSQPEHLIATVLGHEGEGSLLNFLKKEKLAEKLSCGAGNISENSLFFHIKIELTENGIANVTKVVEACFQALHLLKTEEFPKYIYDETQKIQIARYQYQSRRDTYSHLFKLGSLMVYEPLNTFPERLTILPEFDAEEIKSFVSHLIPQHALFLVSSPHPNVEFDHTEKWLQVPYSIMPIDPHTINAWVNPIPNSHIHFPEPNPFLPKSLKIGDISTIENSSKLPLPTILVNTNKAKIYCALDQYFRTPHTQWFFEIKTPSINAADPLKVVLADLYLDCLNDSLNKFTYPAELADLAYRIAKNTNGIAFTVQGYHENAEILFDIILEKIKTCVPTEPQFNLFKNSLLRKYRNFNNEGPIYQAYEIYEQVIFEAFTTQAQKAAALENVTYNNFLNHLSHLFDKTFVEGLFYGSIDPNQCHRVYNKIESLLEGQEYPEKERIAEKIVLLPEENGTAFIEIPVNSQSHAAILGIEEPTFSFKARAAQQILSQALKSSFFDTLRTKQQTGYIAFSDTQEIKKHLFFSFAVQSANHDPKDLIARYELFLENFLREMDKNGLTQEGFENIKKSLIHSIKNQPQNLFEAGSLLNVLAFECEGDFDWMNKRLAGFEELTYEEFLELAHRFIGKQNQRRFAIAARGTLNPNVTYINFETPQALKEICRYEKPST